MICRLIFRLARAGPRSEPTTYETIAFNGSFRRADSAPRGTRTNNYPAGLQMLRRPRCGRDDSIPLHSIGGNDIVSVHANQPTHFEWKSLIQIIDSVPLFLLTRF